MITREAQITNCRGGRVDQMELASPRPIDPEAICSTCPISVHRETGKSGTNWAYIVYQEGKRGIEGTCFTPLCERCILA